MKFKLSALAAVLVSSFTLNAMAGEAAPAPAPVAKKVAAKKDSDAALKNLPAALAQPVKGGFTVDKSFKAASGLTGWVIKSPAGQYSIVFTTQDGQSLVAGALVDASGKNLTADYNDKYVPKPDLQKAWDKVEKSAYITTGAKGDKVKSVVYAFLNPNCVFCHYAWKALQEYEKVGLQIRWVPVAILGPSSTGKAAAIMEAADAGAALTEHETGYQPGKDSGIAAVAKPKAETLKALEAHSNLMREFGFQGTPAILYKDAKGQVMAAPGMPRLSDLPRITNLPEQKVEAPELQKFR